MKYFEITMQVANFLSLHDSKTRLSEFRDDTRTGISSVQTLCIFLTKFLLLSPALLVF